MRHVPEGKSEGELVHGARLVSASFTRLAQTFRDLRQHREALKFLVAFWFYNDGIGTIVVMAAAFGAEIGIGRAHLIGAILAVQFIGFPFALLFGRLAGRIGARNGIMIGLVGYLLICCAAWFVDSATDFWALAVAVGMVQGGVKVLVPPPRIVPPEMDLPLVGAIHSTVNSPFAPSRLTVKVSPPGWKTR